MIKR
jgi:hypothetical protein